MDLHTVPLEAIALMNERLQHEIPQWMSQMGANEVAAIYLTTPDERYLETLTSNQALNLTLVFHLAWTGVLSGIYLRKHNPLFRQCDS